MKIKDYHSTANKSRNVNIDEEDIIDRYLFKNIRSALKNPKLRMW